MVVPLSAKGICPLEACVELGQRRQKALLDFSGDKMPLPLDMSFNLMMFPFRPATFVGLGLKPEPSRFAAVGVVGRVRHARAFDAVVLVLASRLALQLLRPWNCQRRGPSPRVSWHPRGNKDTIPSC